MSARWAGCSRQGHSLHKSRYGVGVGALTALWGRGERRGRGREGQWGQGLADCKGIRDKPVSQVDPLGHGGR